MELHHARFLVIRPALRLLAELSNRPVMEDARAEVMLLAIGLQESNFLHRRQVGGPARGYWQFEKNGGLNGILRHQSTGGYAAAVLEELDIGRTLDAAWDALPYSELLAAACARLLLYSDPRPLPAVTNATAAWEMYLRNWRPGKPGPNRWASAHERSCVLCEDLS